MLSGPVSGVATMNATVAPGVAPCRRSPSAVGRTPQQQTEQQKHGGVLQDIPGRPQNTEQKLDHNRPLGEGAGGALRMPRPRLTSWLLRQIFLVQRTGHRELRVDHVGDVEMSR